MDEKLLKTGVVSDKVVVSSSKVLKKEVYEATLEARDVVALGQQKAKQIIEEAERERENIREQARLEGVAKGLAEWNQVLMRAAQREGELAKGWEDTILQLSVRVAEKIIGEQLKLQPETIVDIVRQVLKATRAGKHMIIQVNEADAPMVRGRVDRLKESLGVSPEIEIVALATIPRGGCVIDSELGIIDARLETQLKCMEEALLGGSSGD